MKHLFTTTLALAFAISSAMADPVQMTGESAPTSSNGAGPYVGVEAGSFWLQSLNAGNPLSVNFKFKTNWGFNVPLGYDFGNGLGVSISVGHWDSHFDSVTGNFEGGSQKAETNGGIQFTPIMLNAMYRVQIAGPLNFYIGAGAGAVYEKSTFSAYDSNAPFESISFGQLGGEIASFDGMTNTSWCFGFQATAGLSFDFTNAVSMNVGYQFLRVNNSLTVNSSSTSDFNGHTIELGLKWKF